MLKYITQNPDQTIKLGKKISGVLALNSVVALSGELGCGKTTFVKGRALGLGINPLKVNSPSYVLMQ